MTVAALVVSIVALIIALISVVYTRQQAQANKKIAQIEQDRRHEERTPKFTAWIEDMGSWKRLWLRLESPRSLTRLVGTLVEAEGVSFTHSQNGVDPSSPAPIKSASWDKLLEHGESACWSIAFEDDYADKPILRVRCYSDDGDEWTVSVPFDPPLPGPFVY